MADDLPTPPYHIFERRYFEDSEGRRIEFRQLVPGSFEREPGPLEFAEFLGASSVGIVIMGVQQHAPIRFPIVAPSLIEAFKKFDAEEIKAKERAKALAEEKLRAKQQELAGRIVVVDKMPAVPPGARTPLIAGL